jgi:aspartate kinase
LKVLKFGGSCLKDSKGFRNVANIIKNEEERRVVILSGVCGVTNTIQNYLNYEKIDEIAIKGLINHLKRLHFKIASEAITDIAILKKVQSTLDKKLQKLEKLLRGVYYVNELTDKTRDKILSYGERLSVPILAGALNDRGIKAKAFDADNLGILTNGDYGKAIAILEPISKNLKKQILPLLNERIIPIITGFFGCDNNGHTTIFGRNGSDYSASIIAYSLDADRVDLWKNVDGFLSADPSIIDDAYLIKNLSYREAAELSYFGAKILHPRTVEPLMKKNIKLHIKNVYNPNIRGTNISDNGHKNKEIIKSIAYNKEISCIKIHGSGVGEKPGVLLDIVSKISSKNINIISVVTSQTCITLLLESKDLKSSFNLLSSKQIKTVERVEKIKDIALIAIVGEGLLKHYGIAAKVSSAVANSGINIEMISAGASEVAYYFIVKENDLERAVKAIHKELSIPVFSKIN